MIFAIFFVVVFLFLQVEIHNLFKYSCFGCGLKVGFNPSFRCEDCGTDNDYGEPIQHSCFNPDYCAICTRNKRRVKEISYSSTNYSGSVFCDLCLHNQQIRLTLTKNEQFASLYRHPLACSNCEILVNRRIEYINQEFRKDVFYKRLMLSKQIHLNQVKKPDLTGYVVNFFKMLISILQLLVVAINSSDHVDKKFLLSLVLFIPTFKAKVTLTRKAIFVLIFQMASSIYVQGLEKHYKSELQLFLICWVVAGYLLHYKSLLERLLQNPWTDVNLKEAKEHDHDIVNPLSLN